VFVLSEGALRFRLRAGLRPLVQANPERALFVTQYAPNEVWQVGSAMQRNRTILGLSRALFIIEAGLDGGTWDAALEAERLKHPLYVLDLPSTERGNGAILARGVAQPIGWQGDLPQFPDLTSPPKQLSLW
jgi:predicted Rossmann fold nucleotide-binding protein DprA/Smf involved in DNA uptake